ncbi:hypothetical protein BASA50_007042 [Batrachochytrium salamandrivorans]|uniref:non-specific serine/threonine protein kinase n=1 Tax=Batrachochytrium salamandrivorans TaxID=1357716 RepID=A0ABQ8FB72_9FUNG|nr:hypothetical protein BASA61_006113 [Batrachochytrium salamandrivorans]KAH6593816.1 hypothetical protein BASA50_007042 [Batrachochytrium salamandrivorans]KAH9252304.1 hypothetical protein BASA81_009757 [Batrachochytrium salamandrivorans]KAH9272345.1 hypothetical protein BASA83_005438 [Batrachochytrium salamandrivorans]
MPVAPMNPSEKRLRPSPAPSPTPSVHNNQSASQQQQKSDGSSTPPSAHPSAANGGGVRPAAPTAPAAKPRPLRVISHFLLSKTIGQGSMGKVKIATCTNTGKQYACKIVPKPLRDASAPPNSALIAGPTSFIGAVPGSQRISTPLTNKLEQEDQRIIREIAITLLLSHPNIVPLHEIVVSHDHYYLFFEHIDGPQMLDFIISHGRLKEKFARRFMRQIISAVDYCHQNSIVHRDLKIENILIDKNGQIKLIDFGLANLYSPKSLLSTFCGSLYFAAPELLSACKYVGPEVDIWSMGVIMYVLVCGRVPFDDSSLPALHAKIKAGRVEYPSFLSEECIHMLSQMLTLDPSKRATIQTLQTHPWITKDGDIMAKTLLPERQPLCAPFDMDVIEHMCGFQLGTPQQIVQNLTMAVNNEVNADAAAERHPLIVSKRLQAPPSAIVSVYRLVSEKLAKERGHLITNVAESSKESISSNSRSGPVASPPLSSSDMIIDSSTPIPTLPLAEPSLPLSPPMELQNSSTQPDDVAMRRTRSLTVRFRNGEREIVSTDTTHITQSARGSEAGPSHLHHHGPPSSSLNYNEAPSIFGTFSRRRQKPRASVPDTQYNIREIQPIYSAVPAPPIDRSQSSPTGGQPDSPLRSRQKEPKNFFSTLLSSLTRGGRRRDSSDTLTSSADMSIAGSSASTGLPALADSAPPAAIEGVAGGGHLAQEPMPRNSNVSYFDGPRNSIDRGATLTSPHSTSKSSSSAFGGIFRPRPLSALDHKDVDRSVLPAGRLDDKIKYIYFKGFFTVKNTSAQHPEDIRDDFIRVLRILSERQGITYIERSGMIVVEFPAPTSPSNLSLFRKRPKVEMISTDMSSDPRSAGLTPHTGGDDLNSAPRPLEVDLLTPISPPFQTYEAPIKLESDIPMAATSSYASTQRPDSIHRMGSSDLRGSLLAKTVLPPSSLRPSRDSTSFIDNNYTSDMGTFGTDSTRTNSPSVPTTSRTSTSSVVPPRGISNPASRLGRQTAYQAVRFEIELCKITWSGLYGVQFHRVTGDSWQYKRMCQQMLDMVTL